MFGEVHPNWFDLGTSLGLVGRAKLVDGEVIPFRKLEHVENSLFRTVALVSCGEEGVSLRILYEGINPKSVFTAQDRRKEKQYRVSS